MEPPFRKRILKIGSIEPGGRDRDRRIKATDFFAPGPNASYSAGMPKASTSHCVFLDVRNGSANSSNNAKQLDRSAAKASAPVAREMLVPEHQLASSRGTSLACDDITLLQ